jgi:rhomboid protease GluP
MFPLPSVGASGAVFGIAGLILATMRWGNVPLPKDVRNAVYKDVLRFSALNLVIGFLPHIDNMGHLGGLLSGVLLGTVLGKNLDRSTKAVRFRLIAWTILLALLAVAVWAAMAQYRRIVRGI